MRRSVLFLAFAIVFPLFSGSDWDDDEDGDDYWGNCAGHELVSYGGMSFYCDYGCGDPDRDADAQAIQYLYRHWLTKPLFGPSFSSSEEDFYTGRFSLGRWEEGKLFDTRLAEHFDEDELNASHGEFLGSSSSLLRDLDTVYAECQGEVERYARRVNTIKKLQLQGARFIEFQEDEDDDEITGYELGSVYFTRIDRAIAQEQKNVEFFQDHLARYDRFRDYAESTFRVIESLYRKIFAWCLENHQPEGLAFRAALEDFLGNDLDGALDQIRFLIEQAEKSHWDNELVAKLCFLHGQVENELCLYSDAIIDLTRSIQKNPANKEAYLERARSYFETGQFEQAFQDFLSSGIKSTPIDPSDVNLFGFAAGLMVGSPAGSIEGISEFFPSLLTSLKTLSSGIWSLAKDPIGVSSEMATASMELFQSIRFDQDTLGIFIPELKDLMAHWDELSSFEQGKSCGRIIGKYGTDILLTLGASQGVSAYTALRRASAIQTFETYRKSETNAAQIAKAARDVQLKREIGQFIDGSFRLKNASVADIRSEKFTHYALKDSGKHHGFKEVLGYNHSNWKDLKSKIQQGILDNKAKLHKVDQHGVRFTVDIPVEGPKGSAVVRTGWIYDPDSQIPRLTTLYVFTE